MISLSIQKLIGVLPSFDSENVPKITEAGSSTEGEGQSRRSLSLSPSTSKTERSRIQPLLSWGAKSEQFSSDTEP